MHACKKNNNIRSATESRHMFEDKKTKNDKTKKKSKKKDKKGGRAKSQGSKAKAEKPEPTPEEKQEKEKKTHEEKLKKDAKKALKNIILQTKIQCCIRLLWQAVTDASNKIKWGMDMSRNLSHLSVP